MDREGGFTGEGVMFAVPAWNEAETVSEVVRDLRSRFPAAVVVVIDDGSADRTGAVARQAGAELVTLPFNVGVGGAMRTAFLYAHRRSFAAVVQVDADGQHDPTFVPELVSALSRNDVVVGSRFAGVGDYQMRGPRRWAARLLSFSLTRMCRSPLTDTTSGFRAAGPRAISLFARHYPAEYLGDTVDSLLMAARSGLTVGEVGVAMRERQGGEPSQNPLRSTLYLGRAVLALTVALTRRLRLPVGKKDHGTPVALGGGTSP